MARCDVFDPASRRDAGVENGRATLVVTNPPFFTAEHVRVSSEARKAGAHVLAGGGHAAWLIAALALLAPKGRLHAIHRPDILPAWLSACEGRLGGVIIVPVHAHAEAPAIRVLVSGIKGSRAPLRLGPALILHEADGAMTPFAQALHRGEASIDMERGSTVRASHRPQ